MPLRAASLATVAAALVLAWPAAPDAQALSCGAPSKPFSELADVVFDGVLLSGPREQPLGRLASPARMQVLRYLKGRGPRVVPVGTDVPLLTPGDDPGVFLDTPGLFEPYSGEIYRIYGYTPRGSGSSTGRGVLTPHTCDGIFTRRTGTYLRGVPGSRVAQRDANERRWAVELLRGPGPLRCLRVHPGLEVDAVECIRPRRRDELLAALAPAGGKSFATAVALSGPDLESMTVESPFGVAEAAAVGPGSIALTVLPGYAERSDVRVRARLRGGRVVPVAGFGAGLLVARGDDQWGVARTASHPPARGVACITFAERPKPQPPNFVTSYPRHGECGRSSGFFAVRGIDRYNDQERPERWATIVFGIAPAGTTGVSVTGPDGERQAAGPSSGVFAAMYVGAVSHRDLTVVFRGDGGELGRFSGLREWNVVRPPRSSLDAGFGR